MTGTKYQAFAGLQAYNKDSSKDPLEPFEFEPRPLEDDEVEIEVSACGICGTDVHQINDGWGRAKFPIVPGHEFIGKVLSRGANVNDIQVGQRVGVSPVCRSCGECTNCKEGYGQYCTEKIITYNGNYKGQQTYGGFANRVRVQAAWAIPIPDNIKDEDGAPLLCAGITSYMPFKYENISKGASVGIVGIGGIGHLAIQWARAKECSTVLAVSTSDKKKEDAYKLGATDFLVLDKNGGFDPKFERSLDMLVVCGSGESTNWGKLTELIKFRGKLYLIDLPESPLQIPPSSICHTNISIVGLFIGSNQDLKEMLEFASKHNVRPWISTFKNTLEGINQGMKTLMDGKARYRIVISGVGRNIE